MKDAYLDADDLLAAADVPESAEILGMTFEDGRLRIRYDDGWTWSLTEGEKAVRDYLHDRARAEMQEDADA